jgi:phosphoribosylformimino-5-aminoimidazole carboxamide ribotide isomerase
MAPFVIFPAIDLRHGTVVRLKEGDPARQTAYSPDPALTARRWLAAGAAWLHVVNLDGAFGEGDSANRAALLAILREAQAAGARVQFGGGLRSLEALAQVLEMGVARAVFGTLAVENPAVVQAAIRQFGPEQVGASLDGRDGLVQVRGWQDGSARPVLASAVELAAAGLRWLVFTDIRRDGLQTGINLAATRELAEQAGLNVIASGGAASADDARTAQAAGCAGIILGRAIYEGAIDLPALLTEFPQ